MDVNEYGTIHDLKVNSLPNFEVSIEVMYTTPTTDKVNRSIRSKGEPYKVPIHKPERFIFDEFRKNKKSFWKSFFVWTNMDIVLTSSEYKALLACVCAYNILKKNYSNLHKNIKREKSLEEEYFQCKKEREKLLEEASTDKKQIKEYAEASERKMSLEKEVNDLKTVIQEFRSSNLYLETELKKKESKHALELEELKKQMTDDFEKRLELEKQKVKVETTNEFIANKILHDEQVDNHNNYDRKFYDELASRLQSVEKQRDELLRQTELLKIQQIANESKEAAEQSKLQREWQKAEQSQSNAEMLKMKLEMEAKLKEEDLQRERQNLKIENTATQFDLQRQQLQVNFAAMKNELTEMGLSFQDFVLQKTYEFKTYELGIKEHLLKMGEMINYADAKNLESERIKMEVMERISQMGLELKQHETFLEKNLLTADRLKLETDRQNMVNEKQANEIALEMQRFNVDYGSKRNQLDQLMLKTAEAQFHNHAKASMLEMDHKVFEIQTELKGMAFERIGMDMMFKEGSMKLSEQENKIAMMKVQIEQKAKELQSLQKIGQLTSHIESEKLKSMQRELGLKGQISHMQNQLDREYMRADYMRQTMNFLNG